ncbi:MAG: 16S rRNA (adenine(1518)-N(6)/adenine(1519)-N(6))-dimethyltransferase RsmA [Verrucomicrobiota bacterium]
MKLSEIQSALEELDATPTKSLGQNFLHDQNLADWTVEQLGIQPGEAWLEIGPGLGALTEFALARSNSGTLIEKDDRLIEYLGKRFPNLNIVHGDASRFDVRNLFTNGPIKVFGNLPYYVSSQIIFNFTGDATPVTGMVFTLQRELAERLAANPSSKEYGGPTVLIGRKWIVRLLRTLPPTVFLPAPKVESAVVSLTPRPFGELPDCDGARFTQLVKLGFSQRRKQLGKLISPVLPQWRDAAAALDLSPTARAEDLSIEQWCQVSAWSPESHSSPYGQDVHGEIFDIVDASDQVIAQKSRHEAHSQSLRHRAIHVFIFNKKGEVFLQRRSRWKDVCPQRWDSSAAGHVDAGHHYDETAPRELHEELGVSTELQRIAKIDACEETGNEFVALYVGSHEGPFQLSPSEIECGEWFSSETLNRWIQARPDDFAPGFLVCWKTWLRSQSSQSDPN